MTTWSQGVSTPVEIVDKSEGAVRFHKYQELKGVINNITSRQHKNVFCEEYAKQLANAFESSESLGTHLDGVQLHTTYAKETKLDKQLNQVARLIATREARKAERDFFFVKIAGFDAHSNSAEVLAEKFKQIDDALRSFVGELKAQNIFDKTVLASESEFGRTLTSNGAGTDHGWAGNHFVLGGSVNGGHVFNDFPASLLPENEQDAGRGRQIPKYPWESMMLPIAEWLGVDQSTHSQVFPNLANFDSSHLIPKSSLFKF